MDKNYIYIRQKRIIMLFIIVILMSFLLIGKLFKLQLSNKSEYDKKIIRQSIRKIRIPSQRGKIYTSDLLVLADTIPEVNLLLYVNEIRLSSRKKTIEYIEQLINELDILLNRKSTVSSKDILRHLIQKPGLPLLLYRNLNPTELAIANNKITKSDGLTLEVDSYRIYPEKTLASHIIGYIGKDDSSKADDRNDFSYYINDYVGKSGIEKQFDRIKDNNNSYILGLRGYPGYSVVQVDNLGYVRKNIIQEVAPINGNHVVLTIDSKAQKLAEKLLQGHNAALVLVDALNGDILAMNSAPNYNLDFFAPIVNGTYYRALLNNQYSPLLNKATHGQFSPGSIIKPLIGLAILESGVAPEDTIDCDGTTHIGNAKINCTSHYYGGHGDMNLYQALEKSCNDYFIEHGLELTREKIYNMLVSANLGTAPKLEIPTNSGTLPTPENKRRIFKSNWTSFDTGLISIGQGILTVSPLQAALYTAALANGGVVYQPHLVKSIVDENGNILQEREKSIASNLAAKRENIEAVKIGMFNVVNAPRGSGRNAKVDGLEIYGKTGTAEIGSRANRRQNTWFIAFCTYNNRSYALAVIVEDGKSGGSTCAPIVAEFLETYLLKNK